ncbi:MAG: hypothetical protein QM811_14575 [Pirellulales bacterium]
MTMIANAFHRASIALGCGQPVLVIRVIESRCETFGEKHAAVVLEKVGPKNFTVGDRVREFADGSDPGF